MASNPKLPKMSVEEYLAFDRASLEAKYEYIDGFIRLMSGGTLDHAQVSGNIYAALASALRSSDCRAYNSDARVQISATRYVYPDVTVSCDESDRGKTDIIRSPRLVVEVLSPSTDSYDHGRKSDFYRACPSIEEIVLINATRQRVEVYRRAGAFWNFFSAGQGGQIELASIDLTLPLATIYDGVDVPPEEDIPSA